MVLPLTQSIFCQSYVRFIEYDDAKLTDFTDIVISKRSPACSPYGQGDFLGSQQAIASDEQPCPAAITCGYANPIALKEIVFYNYLGACQA